MKVKYKCLKCEYEYELDEPEFTQCYKCLHLWVEWVNYTEWREKEMKPLYGDKY